MSTHRARVASNAADPTCYRPGPLGEATRTWVAEGVVALVGTGPLGLVLQAPVIAARGVLAGVFAAVDRGRRRG